MDVTQFAGVLDPLIVFWNSLVLYLPGIIGALIVIIVGWFLSVLVGFIVKKIVNKSKIDDLMVKHKMADAIGGIKPSVLAGAFIKWWLFVAFLSPAANFIKLTELANILTALAMWIPHLIAAIIIVLIGLIFAYFLAKSAAQAKKLKGIKLISEVIRIVIIIFFVDIALRQIGIEIILAEMTILMILAGIILVFVIGFGVALIKPAQKIIEDQLKKVR